MNSILTSIKKLLGIEEAYEQFDADIIMHINSVLMTLTQIGIGNPDGFVITDSSQTWEEYSASISEIAGIKSFVYLKVKLLFDPPLQSSVVDNINKQIAELEWRLMISPSLHTIS